MTDVFMYADETGNLDYNVAGGGSKYFGIGTATWHGEPGEHLWQAERMRLAHSAAGFENSKGYHAKDDSRAARSDVYALIQQQAPRFDTTFLAKSKAYGNVRARGQAYLYQLAWYLHFKEIARQVTGPGDTLHVAVATLGTAARKTAFQQAILQGVPAGGSTAGRCVNSPTGTRRRAGGSRWPTTRYGPFSGTSSGAMSTTCPSCAPPWLRSFFLWDRLTWGNVKTGYPAVTGRRPLGPLVTGQFSVKFYDWRRVKYQYALILSNPSSGNHLASLSQQPPHSH